MGFLFYICPMENTTTENKLISEYELLSIYTYEECLMGRFMGYELYPINKPYVAIKHPNGTVHFKSDWNWLMEVVKQIENLGFEFFIVESRCKIAHNTDKSIETIIDFEIVGTKIEATYKGCIDFIKWYNQQNS